MSIEVIKAIFETSKASGSDRMMLLAVAVHLNAKGVCWPSIDRLAKHCNTSPRNAIRLVENLRQLGELEVQRCAGPNGVNLYRVTLQALTQASPPDTDVTPDTHDTPPDTSVTPDTGDGVTSSVVGGDTQRQKGVTPVSPKQQGNNQEQQGTSSAKLPTCPSDSILKVYHEVLPELPRALLLSDKRKRTLSSFWKWVLTTKRTNGDPRATTAEEALNWIREYFERARDNDFLMGRTPRSEGHANWRCDLDFLLTDKGKSHVIEKTEASGVHHQSRHTGFSQRNYDVPADGSIPEHRNRV